MSTSFRRITAAAPAALPLYDLAALRGIETQASAALPPHALMQAAGLACARFALAFAPHARRIWIACGPGNNGGDGLEAAIHLQQWGKQVQVSLRYPHAQLPADAAAALQRARDAGVAIHDAAPADWDLGVDALFGIGARTTLDAPSAQWVQALNAHAAPVLALDVPSGLDAFTGQAGAVCVRADATLTLIGAKPGLFTAQGRDAAGEVWLHDLGVQHDGPACAELNPQPATTPRTHASHKGSYGDVAVLGGDRGMTGAAVLAASSALHSGAGRVYLGLLEPAAGIAIPPDVMQRAPDALPYADLCVVAGCGGGPAISAHLPHVLQQSRQLVLDADALNALAAAPEIAALLRARSDGSTVLTPHPLEAARLLSVSTAEVQANRLQAAQFLAERFDCSVVLKGSGSVIASPGRPPRINPTGNARLASGGTGDVLAGMVGAYLAGGMAAHEAASAAVFRHGLAADQWPAGRHLTAGALAQSL